MKQEQLIAKAYITLAEIQLEKGNLDHAFDCIKKAQENDPSCPEISEFLKKNSISMD